MKIQWVAYAVLTTFVWSYGGGYSFASELADTNQVTAAPTDTQSIRGLKNKLHEMISSGEWAGPESSQKLMDRIHQNAPALAADFVRTAQEQIRTMDDETLGAQYYAQAGQETNWEGKVVDSAQGAQIRVQIQEMDPKNFQEKIEAMASDLILHSSSTENAIESVDKNLAEPKSRSDFGRFFAAIAIGVLLAGAGYGIILVAGAVGLTFLLAGCVIFAWYTLLLISFTFICGVKKVFSGKPFGECMYDYMSNTGWIWDAY